MQHTIQRQVDASSKTGAVQGNIKEFKKIKNPTAYMLTILYNAPEQYYLDMTNQISNDTAKIEQGQNDKINPDEKISNKSNFHNFKQRTYDYDALEQELLNRKF